MNSVQKNILYISYDGMTDNLGMSQVLPYLKGLSSLGYTITLVSFEKQNNYSRKAEFVKKYIGESPISWQPLIYHKFPPVLSTLYDVSVLKKTVRKILLNNKIDIIHCRSYITSLVGLMFKMNPKYKIFFVFDMRGLWVDERVDGGLWNLKNPLYKTIYNYFKKKERAFLSNSDAVVSLTHKAKEEILSWNLTQVSDNKIKVIPCCVDLELFNPESAEKNGNPAGIVKGKDFIVSYLGSIGTWYMLEEMLDFFACLKDQIPNAKFLVLTPDTHIDISEKLKERSINRDDFIMISANRNEVPSLLALSDLALYFIKPLYSKISSSPTKLAEIMGLGIPIITNRGIGDTEEIFEKYNAGLFVNDFTKEAYKDSIKEFSKRDWNKKEIMNGAQDYFSLKKGVDLYNTIYKEVLNEK